MGNTRPKTKKISTINMVMCALFVALVAVGAFIRIPIPYMDYFTLQFFFVLLAGLILGARMGAISVGCYVLLGLFGIPIFAAGGGFGYVFRPSFGYLLGFIVAAFVVGAVSERLKNTYKNYLAACLAGFAVTYAIGIVYKYMILNYYADTPATWAIVLLSCFPLDMPGDFVLCLLASGLGVRLKKSGIGLEDRSGRERITMNFTEELKNKVLDGMEISREEALKLYGEPLEEVCGAADEIRRRCCRDSFDVCTIINGKSGKCPEDCKFCAQSVHYGAEVDEYALLDTEDIVKQARHDADRGVVRYSIVTSGKSLSDDELDKMCEAVRAVKENADIEMCVSFGLLSEEQYRKLKEAGVSRVHNNLETSERNFPNVCTTHKFSDKLNAIKAAKRAGLDVCSGGVVGMGETIEDRIDMAMTLRELGIKSVPVNMLNPIAGTPYEHNSTLDIDEMRRIVAVYRFVLPTAAIRLAGGRGLLEDKGRGCFQSGANAVISGDMLTTEGYTVETDMKLLDGLGYKAEKYNG